MVRGSSPTVRKGSMRGTGALPDGRATAPNSKRTNTMKVIKQTKTAPSTGADIPRLLDQYGGPVKFTGTEDALYERHLVFDNVMEDTAIDARERFEAIARSVRDVLSQRWLRTEETYERENAKRVYYLSLEFLIGRSLANNVTNLLCSDFVAPLAA